MTNTPMFHMNTHENAGSRDHKAEKQKEEMTWDPSQETCVCISILLLSNLRKNHFLSLDLYFSSVKVS